MSARNNNRPAFTLVELLVVIAIIGVLVGLLLPAVQAARESARRTQCSNNLKQLGIAMQTYHDSRGHYPTGRYRTDQVGIAWSFRLLPFMEHENIFDALDEDKRVDDPNNALAMRTAVATYFCPSRRRPSADRNFDNNDQPPADDKKAVAAGGDYAANAGLTYRYGTPDEPPIENPDTGQELELEEAAGPIFYRSKIRAAQIEDGTSQTFVVGERHIPVGLESNPGLDHHDAGDTAFFAGDHPGTILAGTRNGFPTSPEDPSEDKFGSEHPDLIQFVFLDGHVAGLTTDVDVTTLQRLSTFGDGWPITSDF